MLLTNFLDPPSAQAATSDELNYQARLQNADGSLVDDGDYHVEFKLYDVSAGGSALWTETHTTGNLVRVANGYLSVQLGSITTFPSTIDWSQELWLTINIGGTSGPSWDGEMSPRTKVTAVPYAFVAGTAREVASADTNTASTPSANISIASGNASGTTSNSGNITIDSGTATGTTGTISLGATNASAITIGNTGTTTTNAGALTVTELTTLNGNLTIQAGDTFTFNGDAFTDLTGSGLSVVGNALTVVAGAGSYWTQSASDIYYNTGNVGIGTNGPDDRLDVVGNIDLTGNLQIGNTDVLKVENTSSIALGTNIGSTGSIYNVLIGDNVFGNNSATTANNNVSIGAHSGYSITSGHSNTLVGSNAGYAITTGINNTALGINALQFGTEGQENITIGKDSGYTITTESNNILIGSDSDIDVGVNDSIVLATNGGFAKASNQLVVGGNFANSQITSGFFGSGVVDSTPYDFTLNATGGSGTDITGADLTLAGGRGTGSGNGGSLIFQTAASGGTGTALNPLTTRLTIDHNGLATFNNNVSISGALTVVGTSTLNGNVALGNATGDTLTIAGSSITLSDTTTFNCSSLTNGGKLTVNGSGVLQCANDVGGGSATTLQLAYDNDTDGASVDIQLTSADGHIILRDAATTIGDLFVIENNGSTTQYLTVNATNGVTVDADLVVGTDFYFNNDGSAVFNETGAAVNLRVEGSGTTNLLVTDGTNNRVGIKEGTPLAPLHVTNNGGAYVAGVGGNTVAFFQATTAAGTDSEISVVSGNTGYARVNFGDTDDENVARITYDNSSNSLNFRTNADVDRVRLTSAGDVILDERLGLGGGMGLTDSFVGSEILNIATGGSSGVNLPTFGGSVDVIVADSDSTTSDAIISIIGGSGAGGYSRINFGDSADEDAGSLIYDNNADTLSVRAAAGSDRLLISSTGATFADNVTLGNATGDTLTIAGSSITLSDTTTFNCSSLTNGGKLTVNGSGVLQCANDVGGGSATTLQLAYDNDVDGSNAVVQLTSADGSVILRDAASTIGDLFVVENNGSTTQYLTVNATNGVTVDTDLTVAANNSLILVGGATLPGSPTEGQVFWDSDDERLYIYDSDETRWRTDQSSVNFVVAANDSSALSKAKADYVADGTSDQVEIEAALAALPAAGGTVLLMEGTYTIDGDIDLTSNDRLIGLGEGTVIQMGTDLSVNTNAIHIGGSYVNVSHLVVDGGSQISATATVLDGILLDINSQYSRVEYVTVKNLRDKAIFINDGDYNTIDHVVVTNPGTEGVDLDGTSSNNTISNSTFSQSTNLDGGIFMAGGTDNIVTNNRFIGWSTGIYIGTNNNVIEGNFVSGATTYGIYVSTSSNVSITGNTVTASNDGIRLNATSSYNTVNDNTIYNNTSEGILVYADFTTITGNNIYDNDKEGIELNDASNNLVANNVISNSGQGDVEDGIYIVDDSNNNQIIGNHITDTAGTSYAIEIAAATVDNTYLSNNTYSGTGAASILDNGTNTIYANQLNGPITNNTSSIILKSPSSGTLEVQSNTNITGNLDVSGTINAGTGNAFQVSSAGAVTAVGVNSGTGQIQGTGGLDVDGTIVLGSSDSNTLLEVRDAADNAYLTVDTDGATTGLAVRIGAGSDDVVLVLDAFNADPSTAVDGAMFYDADDEKFRCHINGSWADCNSGGGGGDTTVNFYPEYEGAILYADGTNNSGTLASGYVTGLAAADEYERSYYNWSTSQSTAQDYDIIVTHELPSDFNAFVANSFKIWTYEGSATGSTITFDVQNATDNSNCLNAVDVTPAEAAGNWEEVATTHGTSMCTAGAGDRLVITIRVGATSSTGNIRVGEFEYQYTQ